MQITPSVLRAFAFGLMLLAPARAADVTYSAATGPIAIGGAVVLTFPQFDGTLGVLRSVRVSALSSVSGTWSVENLNASANTFGGYSSGTYVSAVVTATLPSGFMPGMNPAFLLDPAVTLPAFDGVADFGGTSGTTIPFTGFGDGSPGQFADIYMDSGLPAYAGTGTIPVTVSPVFAVGPNMPPGFQTSVTRTTSTSVQVRYTYDPFPTRICRAASFSGCPCGNSSLTSSGCGNSTNANGGSLNVAGASSITSDSLVLLGTGMPDGGALYFEGTNFALAQIVYGDGLLCVGGTIVRLGVKFNAAGASQYPTVGDPSISISTGIAAPGVRTYQVWYRDAASYCTAATFNFTNGVAVQWTP